MKKLLSLVLVLAMALSLVPGLISAEEAIPTIKWIQVGNEMPKNYDAWKAAMDEYLEEKIGAHIEMEIVNWGDWNQRRNVIVNTNEEYDILFTNNETFANDVRLGAFADITSLLDKTPALKDLLSENHWNSVTLDGKVYGVPTLKDNAIAIYFIWDEDVAKKYDIDINAIKEFANLDEAFQKMKAEYAENGNYPLFLTNNGLTHITSWYDKLGVGLPLGVHYKDDSRKVVSIFEQEDIQANLALLHKWFKDGIVNLVAASQPEDPKYRMFFVEQGWSLAAKTTWGPNMGLDDNGDPIHNIEAIQWGDIVLTNDSIQGSISCISASSKNPEKALQLLELVNTDSFVRDRLYYGEEGVDYNYVEKDGEQRIHRISTDWPMAGYTQGSFFAATRLETDEYDQWAEVAELNEKALASPTLGFQFNYAETVGDEVIACKAIWEDFKSELMTGTIDPEIIIPEMMEELRAAGFDKIMEEAQAQIDAQFK